VQEITKFINFSLFTSYYGVLKNADVKKTTENAFSIDAFFIKLAAVILLLLVAPCSSFTRLNLFINLCLAHTMSAPMSFVIVNKPTSETICCLVLNAKINWGNLLLSIFSKTL
jgi:hypothetical protein